MVWREPKGHGKECYFCSCVVDGQQSGFIKYFCCMCDRDSMDRINHWIKRDWPLRESLTPSFRNILHPALANQM